MERPEKPTRRWFLKGLAATAGAGAGAYLLKHKKESTTEESEKVPEGREELPSYGPFGMRSILQDQLRRREAVHFGASEQLHLDKAWRGRMKTPALMDSLISANQRIRAQGEVHGSRPFLDILKEEFERNNVPPKLLYIAFSETWFKLQNGDGGPMVSRTGAVGPYQFQRDTAIEYGLMQKDANGRIIRDDRADPIKSGRAAARYLKRFADAFKRKGTPENEAWDFAVLSYNGGYAQGYLRKVESPSMAGFREYITNAMQIRLEVEKRDRTRPVQPRETLKTLSARYGLTEKALREVNPQVDWSKLIAHRSKIYIPGIERAPHYVKVENNETLPTLVRRLGTTERALRDKNPGLGEGVLTPGSEITVPMDADAHRIFVNTRKLLALSGYIENLDYLAKTKAIIHAVENLNLSTRVPLPRPRPRFDSAE